LCDCALPLCALAGRFLLEALPKLGMGASSRNSGMIHSGLYDRLRNLVFVAPIGFAEQRKTAETLSSPLLGLSSALSPP
jgi:hypothetical protein